MDAERENAQNPEVATGKTEFLPGAVVFGKFKIVRSIGSGGMEKVFEVLDLDLQESRALKILLSHALNQPGAIRFQTKPATPVASVPQSPNYDFGVSQDGTAYRSRAILR